MKKALFKKILCIINYLNIPVEQDNLQVVLQQQLKEEKIEIGEESLRDIIFYIQSVGILYKDHVEYDLIPCGCVFAKANNGSISEALAFLECLMKQPTIYAEIEDFVTNQTKKNWSILLNSMSYDIVIQTALWDHKKHTLQSSFVSNIVNILTEYKKNNVIISDIVSAIYTNELLDNDDSLKYRNKDSIIVEYSNLSDILYIIPKRGIPENRDVTRPTQSFYKDTLMYEFQHTCPICGINIPHMLIASHIKPFRDCAHIYETLDHHNGLLLCRNHDYLFDQGLFSFDDHGAIMISQNLLHKHHLNNFAINKQITLAQQYMDTNRKLFLKYHREHIFKP